MDDILQNITLVHKIFSNLIGLACIGLLLACNVYLIKRVFGSYSEKQCENKTYKCVSFTKWSYAGIIINLYFFCAILLGMIIGLFKPDNEITILGKIIIVFIMCIMILCIIGSSFLLQQNKLPCDDSYICNDSNSNITGNFKNLIIKFSAIIGLIINSIFSIGLLLIINEK